MYVKIYYNLRLIYFAFFFFLIDLIIQIILTKVIIADSQIWVHRFTFYRLAIFNIHIYCNIYDYLILFVIFL